MLDPNTPQAPGNQEAIAEQVAAGENAGQETTEEKAEGEVKSEE